MSLFKQIIVDSRPNGRTHRRQHRSQPWQGRFPKALENLQRHCPCCRKRLGLQIPLQLIGRQTADNGRPMAVLACSLCNARQGWTLDMYTGAPYLLWPRRPR